MLAQLFASEPEQVAAGCYPNGVLGAVNDEDDDSSGNMAQHQLQPSSLYQPLTVNLSGVPANKIQLAKSLNQPPLPVPATNRYSYRAAIYRTDGQLDLGWRVMAVLSACVV